MRIATKWVSVLVLGWVLFGGSAVVFAEGEPLQGSQIAPIPDVVARVNGNDVSSKYVKFEFNRVLQNARRPLPAQDRDKLVRKIIDKEVENALIYEEGQKLDVKVDPAKIEAQLESLRSAYKTNTEFQEALSDRKITVDDLKRSIEVGVLTKIIIEKQVKGQIEIDDAKVKKYYDDNREKFNRPKSYRTAHILISPLTPELIRNSKVEELRARRDELTETARKRILEIQEELKGGADLAELAKKYSHDEATAKNGGDLGFFYLDGVEKSFGDAVVKLEIGGISDVVETNFGFHLIKLVETKPSEYASFKEMESAIQRHLYMEAAQDKIANYMSGLRKNAKIVVLY